MQALIALKQRAQMAHKALGPATGSGQAPNPERAASRLDELEKLIDQELISLRRLIGDLRPIYLEDLGFVPALEMLAKQVGERHALDVRLDVRGETVRLAPDLELAAFRIVQQALANVAAHAQAQHAVVGVAFARDGLTLSVRDDGRGFVPPDQPADLVTRGPLRSDGDARAGDALRRASDHRCVARQGHDDHGLAAGLLNRHTLNSPRTKRRAGLSSPPLFIQPNPPPVTAA